MVSDCSLLGLWAANAQYKSVGCHPTAQYWAYMCVTAHYWACSRAYALYKPVGCHPTAEYWAYMLATAHYWAYGHAAAVLLTVSSRMDEYRVIRLLTMCVT